MRNKKSIRLAAVNEVPNIESKHKFKITLTLKNGSPLTATFSARPKKGTIRDKVISECRKIMLNIKKKEGRDGKDERLYIDLSLKNIDTLKVMALD